MSKEDKKPEKTPDEEVNGPLAAARILENMPQARRDAIVSEIRKSDPGLALKIEANLVTFEDIADLFPQGLQLLIKEVEHKDLVVSFKKAGERVRTALLENMSERKRQSFQEDFAALPQMPLSEVEAAQQRILKKLDELRTAGLIRTKSESDTWV